MQHLYLIVGRSGSGKTYLAEKLADYFNAKILESYTTRAKREPNETGHTFATKDDYLKAKELGTVVAETLFSDNYYWAEAHQIEECHLYVIDPKGVEDVLDAYKKGIIKKRPFVLKLNISREEAKKRMITRGDHPDTVEKRLKHDDTVFSNFYYDASINAHASKDAMVKQAIDIINIWENSNG